MRLPICASLGAILLATTCGPEPGLPPAELEQVCGAPSPFRLLALDPGEFVSPFGGVTRFEDRLIFIAGPPSDDPVFDFPRPDETSVYATGLCGEDPVLIGREITRIISLTRWPGALLGCSGISSGDLYSLDPTGASEPTRIFPGGCDGTFTEHGRLSFEPTDEDRIARVILLPYADGDVPGFTEPLVLHEATVNDHRTYLIRADELLVLDRNRDLLRVALPGGATTLLQADVYAFDMSSDGRYLLWQDARTSDGDPDRPDGDILLRDLQADGDHFVAHTNLNNRWPHFGTEQIRISFGTDAGERFVWLPSLEMSDVSAENRPVMKIADGRWLTSPGFPPTGPWSLLDFATGQTTLVTDMVGPTIKSTTHIDVVHSGTPTDWRPSGPLWRHFYDGSEPELLANRVTSMYQPLPDGRIVTALDLDAHGFGSLAVIDPDTLAETAIDERVFGILYGANLADPADNVLAYGVADGDRTGIWLAKLAPAD